MKSEEQWIRLGVGERTKTSSGVVVGPGDDCAVLHPDCPKISLSVDTRVEGVHFRRDWSSPCEIGVKAIGSSVSDLCGMGASPHSVLLAVALSSDVTEDWARAFWDGVWQSCERLKITVAGGDTTRSPTGIVVSVTAIGEHPDRVLCRTDAKEGDKIWVTGYLGESALGLHILEREKTRNFAGPVSRRLERHTRPTCRSGWGKWLSAQSEVGACMDISDGLLLDLERMAVASEVHLQLRLDDLPLPVGWEDIPLSTRRMKAVSGGEDYELVFTARPSFSVSENLDGVGATCIGVVSSISPGEVTLVNSNGKPIPIGEKGWNPFS